MSKFKIATLVVSMVIFGFMLGRVKQREINVKPVNFGKNVEIKEFGVPKADGIPQPDKWKTHRLRIIATAINDSPPVRTEQVTANTAKWKISLKDIGLIVYMEEATDVAE